QFNLVPDSGKYFKDVNNVFDDFIGTWQWQNGNQTFTVTLWKEVKVEAKNGSKPSYYVDMIKGHYKLKEFQNQNGTLVEVELYNSHQTIGNTNQWWQFAIFGNTKDGMNLSGSIRDVSIDYPNWDGGVNGHLKLTVTSTSPLQMQWEVTLPEGMYDIGQPTT